MTRNITLNADETLIERARARARRQHTTLNAAFRTWLASYAAVEGVAVAYDEVMAQLHDVVAGGPFDRDTLNER